MSKPTAHQPVIQAQVQDSVDPDTAVAFERRGGSDLVDIRIHGPWSSATVRAGALQLAVLAVTTEPTNEKRHDENEPS